MKSKKPDFIQEPYGLPFELQPKGKFKRVVFKKGETIKDFYKRKADIQKKIHKSMIYNVRDKKIMKDLGMVKVGDYYVKEGLK